MRFPISKNMRWIVGFGSLAIVVSAGFLVAALYASEAKDQPEEKVSGTPTTISTGSGEQFKTTVDRKTEGELSAEDFRQVSLLSSRIVLHLNKAATHLGNDQKAEARQELEKGQALVKIVQGLLPKTIVTTVVRDANDKEVYRNVDTVQEDRIPLIQGLIAVKTMEPITDAKQDEAAIQGLRLAKADLVHTSILLELKYVDSKLNRALHLLDEKPEDALSQLMLAQSRGVNFVVNKQDSPLVEAQMALQLAERMVEQGRKEAAKVNLQQAKNHLELYRGLLAKDQSEHVKKLQEEISKLQSDIGRKNAAGSIRGFWDRVTSWFMREPGEMQHPDDSQKTDTDNVNEPKK